ncbi:uncharacterized protein LOC114797316 [Denticeps clupeoides]|uniref:uncharacterized protein LOC114797316 n=1 Tax=Denticeps clupeoides TaxID=299321 RepID=UPI0010A56F7B|nr:uncharacterized protein LOC114797316 [Denticeps clupeoides]XP_028847987.1 uncharacterized protein LOC114797316 [Denticeps clupeoides]
MDIVIRSKKVDLIEWLSWNSELILQHVDQSGIVTRLEYTDLKAFTGSGLVAEILDRVVAKQHDACVRFFEMLKRDEVVETFPPLKEWITTVKPATDFLRSCKATISEQLANKCEDLINKTEDLITIREGKCINAKKGEDRMTELLNVILGKEEKDCMSFLNVLRDFPEFNNAFTSAAQVPGCDIYASGSNVFRPVITDATTDSIRMDVNIDSSRGAESGPPSKFHKTVGKCSIIDSNYVAPVIRNTTVNKDINLSFSNVQTQHKRQAQVKQGAVKKSLFPDIADNLGFLKTHRSALINCVTNVEPILDYLIQHNFNEEMAENVQAERTSQDRMRKILNSTKTTRAAEVLVEALVNLESELMKDLMDLH